MQVFTTLCLYSKEMKEEISIPYSQTILQFLWVSKLYLLNAYLCISFFHPLFLTNNRYYQSTMTQLSSFPIKNESEYQQKKKKETWPSRIKECYLFSCIERLRKCPINHLPLLHEHIKFFKDHFKKKNSLNLFCIIFCWVHLII